MTIETNETQPVVTESTTTKEATFTTVEEAMAEIERLKNINKEVIQSRDQVKTKLRTFEQVQEDQEKAKLEEQGQYKQLLEAERAAREALENKIKTQTINTVLKAKLAEAGARSVDTVMKLVDKALIQVDENGDVVAATIEDQLKALQESDPILFGTQTQEIKTSDVKVPEVKRATEGERLGGFEAEIRTAKTQGDVARIMAKYNK